MTTIAWDGETVAADKRETTTGGVLVSDGVTKIRKIGDMVYAFAGRARLAQAFIDWHLAGAKPENIPKPAVEDDIFIVFSKGECITYRGDAVFPMGQVSPWAWGSGWSFALGAMEHGASAEEAVAIAARRDLATGDDVDVIFLEEVTA